MNTHLPHGRRQRGVTLVECLVVAAIAAILLGIGVPSFKTIVRSAELTSATNDLFASLLLARSEAARRHSRVALCKSKDGIACEATGGWEQGWIIFHDANNNGVRDGAEQVLLRTQALAPDLRLAGNLNVAKYVSYVPTGEAKLTGGGFQAGTITLCNASPWRVEARQIVINATGRPRVQNAKVSACP